MGCYFVRQVKEDGSRKKHSLMWKWLQKETLIKYCLFGMQ